MTTLLMLMGLVLDSAPRVVPLEPPATPIDILQNDQMILADDGSILGIHHDFSKLHHWDADGHLILTISTDNDKHGLKEINTCLYDSKRGIYWISDTISQRCFFFDREGKYLGKGTDQEGNEKFRMRQFITTRGRIFAVDTARVDVWRNPDAPLLNEVSFRIEENHKITIVREGEPFCRITQEQRSMDYNLKQVWVVQDPYHQNLFVVDQLSPRIRHFVPNPRDDYGRVESIDRQISFGLTRYVVPPTTWNTEMRTREQFREWWYSWSRINGFFYLEEGFVVGYDIPDSKLKNRCLLGLQKLGRNGKRIGREIVKDAWFIGVRGHNAYLVTGPPHGSKGLVLSIIAL